MGFNDIFTTEEIIGFLRGTAQFLFLFISSMAGSFTRCAVYRKNNGPKKNIAFSILSATIALWIIILSGATSIFVFGLLISIPIGFFIPSFSNILKGKTIFKILINIFKNAKSLSDSAIDEIEKELD